MRIIPVLDVLNGRVVRGIAGQRDSYQPVKSILTPNTDARSICDAFEQQFAMTEFYIADLDGIERDALNINVLRTVWDSRYRIWLDAGFSSVVKLNSIQRDISLDFLYRIIIGLECCPNASNLESLLQVISPERLVFSLDMQNGEPLLPSDADPVWSQATALQIAQHVIELGVRTLIVLDLAAVGMGNGTPTYNLCRQIKQQYPNLELITGGGVNSKSDLVRLESCCDGVLIASALHDGRLTVGDVCQYR
ncbi:MAG: hypothetical protein CMJ76_15550 [Planctomycetaceae bacterium]|nr:hypothetical protein [Planctomycetaceae bacterium]|tara:strand:+ start:134 stop:883 length:750 start_codon:yes stop_codon:yes gene_type:complete